MTEILFDVFLRFYLVASTVFYWPGMTAYMPQEAFIQYSAFVFFAISFVVPAKRRVSNVYLFLMLMYCIIHTLFLAFDNAGQGTLLNVVLGFLTLKIIAERVRFDFRKMGYLFLGLVAANIFLMALQVRNVDPIFTNMNYDKMPQVDVVGFMGIRFALGVLAALVLPFVFAISPWHCLALIPLFAFSKASTAVAAGVISFLYLLYVRHRRVFWVLVPFIVGGAAYYIIFRDLPTGEFSKRLEVWWTGISVLKMRPYFGFGLGHWSASNFVSVQLNGQPQKWAWAHNEFVQFLFEQGVIGAIFLYAWFKDTAKNFTMNGQGQVITACVLSLFIVSFFHFPFHVGRFAGLSIYILALAQAHKSQFEYLYKDEDYEDEKALVADASFFDFE